MRELKPAIEYFKDAIKESDEIIKECSVDLKAELTKQKKHFAVAVAAMEKQTAKQIMRENDFLWCPICERGGNSWDKSKYCRYCGQALSYDGI